MIQFLYDGLCFRSSLENSPQCVHPLFQKFPIGKVKETVNKWEVAQLKKNTQCVIGRGLGKGRKKTGWSMQCCMWW